MKNRKLIVALVLSAVVVCISVFVTAVSGHCDTMKGPVIPDAMAALEKNDITPILKWIRPQYEAEVKTAFSLAVSVRGQSPQAKELADRYFLETLIRLHRAGEGAPYTGIQDTPPEPIVALADQALTSGSADRMIKELQTHLAESIREKFNAALEAVKNKDQSVEAGREFVEAYVQYMHYVEGIQAAIMTPQHPHTTDPAAGSEPGHTEHNH